ncbi:MAG: hypothetical protein JWN46_625 [Acidimicrobiales bacterium]|nr:hypothetical protein [Acidimicrobiales bacterium]
MATTTRSRSLVLDPGQARGHGQQVAERHRLLLGRQTAEVVAQQRCEAFVRRADQPLVDGDADRGRQHALRRGVRVEADMAIAPVEVPLERHRAVAQHDEAAQVRPRREARRHPLERGLVEPLSGRRRERPRRAVIDGTDRGRVVLVPAAGRASERVAAHQPRISGAIDRGWDRRAEPAEQQERRDRRPGQRPRTRPPGVIRDGDLLVRARHQVRPFRRAAPSTLTPAGRPIRHGPRSLGG